MADKLEMVRDDDTTFSHSINGETYRFAALRIQDYLDACQFLKQSRIDMFLEGVRGIKTLDIDTQSRASVIADILKEPYDISAVLGDDLGNAYLTYLSFIRGGNTIPSGFSFQKYIEMLGHDLRPKDITDMMYVLSGIPIQSVSDNNTEDGERPLEKQPTT